MGVFVDQDAVHDTLFTFLGEVTSDPELRPKFVASGVVLLVQHTGPECEILVDCSQDPPAVIWNPDAAEGAKAEIRLAMSADDGHLFWLGKLQVPIALATKRVRVSGPMTHVMKLLPAMQPAFRRYRAFWEAREGSR